MPVLRGFSRRVKQDSEANEMSVGERHKVPNVAWESKTLLVLEKRHSIRDVFFLCLEINVLFFEAICCPTIGGAGAYFTQLELQCKIRQQGANGRIPIMNAVEEFPFASRSPKDVAWESKTLLVFYD